MLDVKLLTAIFWKPTIVALKTERGNAIAPVKIATIYADSTMADSFGGILNQTGINGAILIPIIIKIILIPQNVKNPVLIIPFNALESPDCETEAIKRIKEIPKPKSVNAR